jgi:hypothetical protein
MDRKREAFEQEKVQFEEQYRVIREIGEKLNVERDKVMYEKAKYDTERDKLMKIRQDVDFEKSVL